MADDLEGPIEFPRLFPQPGQDEDEGGALQAVLENLPDGPWKAPFSLLLHQLTGTQSELSKLKADAARDRQEAEAAENAEVDARRVQTWAPLLKTSGGRLSLRNDLTRRFGEALEVNEAGQAYRHELRSSYDSLWALLPVAHNNPPVLQAMQATIVRMESNRLRFRTGGSGESSSLYEGRARKVKFGGMDDRWATNLQNALLQVKTPQSPKNEVEKENRVKKAKRG
ncbi:hypothetical protein DIPPA_08056 [Diplonema papillatum]|nr:hypothetical protein DIPPA_07123 [Diplonema papillatum]KAJ9458199.1 hypothetical protein DIPPA_33055 [Diplonema papillatum]KAJ9462419.1 hypothetical protein DIPPA_06538 [Diplonema papillatum]KAJ9473251.1 hypothetical protein DIPPA_08056 [Diplonema papillatum]